MLKWVDVKELAVETDGDPVEVVLEVLAADPRVKKLTVMESLELIARD